MIPQRAPKHNFPRSPALVRWAWLALLGAAWPAGCHKVTDQEPGLSGDLVEEWQGGALPAYTPLTAAEIQTVLGQAVAQEAADGQAAVVAVVDREGFVLGVFGMTGASLGPTFPVPATLPADGSPGINAAIAKARTAASLSSNQNAFTSRTAGYIVANHFPPTISYTPGGPLYGVQNSNLTGSDVLRGIGAGGGSISNNPNPLPDP
ncbi:MAG TPA: hypothetical protein VEN81_03025, partial [Planctomycetota bacterium]|nr:hypothetical protein [Planctomycetota bacterium]